LGGLAINDEAHITVNCYVHSSRYNPADKRATDSGPAPFKSVSSKELCRWLALEKRSHVEGKANEHWR